MPNLTSSSINETGVNAEYPVAGQDNDSQGFRDNFSILKTNFVAAKTEIEELQDITAKLNVANDDRISILPTYVPKLVSIPINAKSNSFSTSNFFSTLLISSDWSL